MHLAVHGVVFALDEESVLAHLLGHNLVESLGFGVSALDAFNLAQESLASVQVSGFAGISHSRVHDLEKSTQGAMFCLHGGAGSEDLGYGHLSRLFEGGY